MLITSLLVGVFRIQSLIFRDRPSLILWFKEEEGKPIFRWQIFAKKSWKEIFAQKNLGKFFQDRNICKQIWKDIFAKSWNLLPKLFANKGAMFKWVKKELQLLLCQLDKKGIIINRKYKLGKNQWEVFLTTVSVMMKAYYIFEVGAHSQTL